MSSSTRLGIVAVAALLAAGRSGLEAAEPDGQQILARMKQVYAEARSYRDTGRVHVVVERATGTTDVVDFPFSTLFVRPDRFRFEFAPSADSRNHYVVWADGTAIRAWWSKLPGIEEHESIEFALGGPTGISYSAAVKIPGLLMPEMLWGSGMRFLKQPVVLGDEQIDGRDCHVIEAVAGERQITVWTVWIDKQSSLVRQIRTPIARHPSGTCTLTYQPELDVPLAAEAFVFEPPL